MDEVMQEVALSAVAQRSPLLEPARLVGWLYRLAVRQALIYRRKAGRHRARRTLCSTIRAPVHRMLHRHPWAGCSTTSGGAWSSRRCSRLPPGDADLLVLKYAEGWSAREMADRLGLKTAAVEARLHRARLRLRAELAAQFAPQPEETEDADP